MDGVVSMDVQLSDAEQNSGPATAATPGSVHASSAPGAGFEEERRELEWVLAQPEFARSTSLIRFLTYICDRYFEGETAEIREYSIAVEALGRKAASFDSHVDPIVRVTARSLRKKLHEVYQGEGKHRALRIFLPVGHYVPEFVRPSLATAEQQQAISTEPQEPPVESAKPAGLFALLRHPGSLLLKIVAVLAGVAALAGVFVAGYFLGQRSDRRLQPPGEALAWGDPVWADEFNDAAGQIPDKAKWTYESGGRGSWGKNELQAYCSPRAQGPKECDLHHPNVFEDGQGHLVVRARRGPDGAWTSARISTKGLKDFQYGRMEARLKMPVGSGLWPSFWMLGSAFDRVGWPAAGSVDIAENASLTPRTNGLGPRMIRSVIHGPHYYGGNGLWHDFRLPNGGRVDDGNFHTYGIIWSPGMIQFYVDDPANIFFVQDSSAIPESGEWVFDKPFFLVLNLAVGGEWPGNPDTTTPNPADLLIDYIRAYKIPPVEAPAIHWQPVQVKSGSSAASIVNLQASRLAGRVHLTCSTEPATATCTLGSSVINFSDTLSQETTLAFATQSYSDKGKIIAPPGRYKVTLTATTISGDHSTLSVPVEVTPGD
jgi:beta-glucanase (GH16 family)